MVTSLKEWGVAGPGVLASVRGPLLERDQQLREINAWIETAAGGTGGAVLLRAGAGLGKTALLASARLAAERAGMRVLVGSGRELEREMAFGVTRQLFEQYVRGLSESDRAAALRGPAQLAIPALGLTEAPEGPGDPLGAVHGMYWLTANISDQGPLMLAVDDLHWADSETATFLSYLAPRAPELPLLVIAAQRPEAPIAAIRLHSAIAGDGFKQLDLQPLTSAAIAELASKEFGRIAELGFVQVCHRATGGNPFLLHELLRTAASDGIEPVDSNATEIHHLGLSQVARSILVRLTALGENALRVATAAAVLDAHADVRHVAALSALDPETVLDTWDLLVHADILQAVQPLRFVHPIVRSAVYNDLPPGERTRAHREAARLLGTDGVASPHVAVHAAACEPAGDSEIVDMLGAAAAEALASSAPDSAARYLERALAEPPPPSQRAELRFKLGLALTDVDLGRAATTLISAAELATDLTLRRSAFRWAGWSLAYASRIVEAIAAFDDAIALAEDPDEAVVWATNRDGYALWWTGDEDRDERRAQLHARARSAVADTPSGRANLGLAALDMCMTGCGSADRAMELVGMLDQPAEEFDESSRPLGAVRIMCDDPLPSIYAPVWQESARRGHVLLAAFSRAALAQVELRRGALLDAEEDARAGWEVFAPLRETPTIMYWWTAAPLAQILIHRGLVDEAEQLVAASGVCDVDLDIVIFPWPPLIRAQLAFAHGEIGIGIELLMKTGSWLEDRGFTNPTHVPWRALVAPALAATGRAEEARALIATGLERARQFGSPWALGMCLRAAAAAERGESAIRLLRESIAVLEPSPCRLEHAESLFALGAALRRASQRSEAREHLRAALDIAHNRGAVPLARRAREELTLTGARPRRAVLSGPDSLTGGERRVAELAAAGMSNPEIAQTLFVTRKTVETHLGHIYSKLSIDGREHLAETLFGARLPDPVDER